MSETQSQMQPRRPMRADARRNYDALVAAARDAFTEEGAAASLENVAERAGVGIGTLYRHFPKRQALLEAVYAGEVEAMARSAEELAELPPWDALSEWFHRYVGFAATKRALTEALLEAAPESDVLLMCRTALMTAGTGLIERAQKAGVVRPDATFVDVGRMVSGIAVVSTGDPEQTERMLQIVLDGLRPRPG
ncbi:MAG: TetR/AcrR family transcriptional regulator [Actinobacteria bacterium]|nr:MAG: TetR/AcrR family transcriptional regulator [Actinomycetota bacterium]